VDKALFHVLDTGFILLKIIMMRFAGSAKNSSASNEVYRATEDDSKPEVLDGLTKGLGRPLYSIPSNLLIAK